MGRVLITCNKRLNNLPNIWLFASAKIHNVDVVDVDSQQITIDCSDSNLRHRITFVYAGVFYTVRHQLWDKVINLKGNWQGPYLTMGDFNAILGAHERSRDIPLNISCMEFKNFIDSCRFSDIDARGSFYTWTKMV